MVCACPCLGETPKNLDYARNFSCLPYEFVVDLQNERALNHTIIVRLHPTFTSVSSLPICVLRIVDIRKRWQLSPSIRNVVSGTEGLGCIESWLFLSQ